MDPTMSNMRRLRRLLDEQIPEGGSDTDTRFLEEDIAILLKESSSIYEAASKGWTEKAGMYEREMAGIEQTTTGQETYRYTSLRDRLAYALRMAEMYAEMALGVTGGSRILRVVKPEVL